MDRPLYWENSPKIGGRRSPVAYLKTMPQDCPEGTPNCITKRSRIASHTIRMTLRRTRYQICNLYLIYPPERDWSGTAVGPLGYDQVRL